MATLTGIRLEYFRGGDLAALGRAAEVTYERTTGELTARQVVVQITSRDEPGSLRPAVGGMELSAPWMVGNLFHKQAEGSRGVLIRTGAGIVAQTEKARIDGEKMRASGTDPIQVEGPGYTLSADSFQSSLTEDTFEFGGRVKSQFGRQQ
jgi:lipopolysaccharide export system protein LptC